MKQAKYIYGLVQNYSTATVNSPEILYSLGLTHQYTIKDYMLSLVY